MSTPLLLAIDAGNTNIVFALFEGDRLVDRWRAATDSRRTADEYAVWLTQLMALDGRDPADVADAVIASVVPQATFALATLCRKYFACEPFVIDNGADLGLAVRIDRPQEVGADRLVNAIAAHARYPGWLIVVDFGTATTFDVITDDGAYEGGIIAPGINLSLEALERAAARLPRISVERPNALIGKGTIDAMRSGVYWGYVGLIEGLVSRIKDQLGKPATVVATGGLAAMFNDATDAIDLVDPDLTLIGLRMIHQRQHPGP